MSWRVARVLPTHCIAHLLNHKSCGSGMVLFWAPLGTSCTKYYVFLNTKDLGDEYRAEKANEADMDQHVFLHRGHIISTSILQPQIEWNASLPCKFNTVSNSRGRRKRKKAGGGSAQTHLRASPSLSPGQQFPGEAVQQSLSTGSNATMSYNAHSDRKSKCGLRKAHKLNFLI